MHTSQPNFLSKVLVHTLAVLRVINGGSNTALLWGLNEIMYKAFISGCRPGLSANWITGQVSRKVLAWVSEKGRWQEAVVWPLLSRCHFYLHSRNGGTGPVNQVCMAPRLAEQQSGAGGRQPTCLHRLCAQCYQHRMLLLILPPDWVSLPLALPCPPCLSPAPSACVATGKEEWRRLVSGGLGCVLGRPLLLLPPGRLGLSSHDPSAASRRAASCN